MKNIPIKKALTSIKIKKKPLKQREVQKLFFDMDQFRVTNKKFILPGIYEQETVKQYKIVHVNNTESYG